MLVELDDEHTKCGICIAKFSSDRDNKNPEIRKHLPVLSSSQRCDHWFCHGCILREQLRVAEENNGKIPKWIKCMHCREKTSFNPAEPKYHRLLIDLLARAQKYAAAQVKAEQTEVEENETTDAAPVKQQEQNDAFNEDYAASEAKVARERDDAYDDEARSVKRESDITDHVEQEVKRAKLMTPSPSLVRVKEEPTEFDDDYDEATSLERRTPINRIDTASTNNADFTPAAPKVEDNDQLLCSICNVTKSPDCFSLSQRRRSERIKMITWDLRTVKCMECIGKAQALIDEAKEKRRLQIEKMLEAEKKLADKNKAMEDLEVRTCVNCNIVKKKEEFDINERKNGVTSVCMGCNEVTLSAVEAAKEVSKQPSEETTTMMEEEKPAAVPDDDAKPATETDLTLDQSTPPPASAPPTEIATTTTDNNERHWDQINKKVVVRNVLKFLRPKEVTKLTTEWLKDKEHLNIKIIKTKSPPKDNWIKVTLEDESMVDPFIQLINTGGEGGKAITNALGGSLFAKRANEDQRGDNNNDYAQKYAAAQMKNEEQELCVDMQLDLGSSNAMCMKRECNAVDDEDEREMKRPKLLAPPPQHVQVKEEPVESDDQYDPPPLVDSAPPMSDMTQLATTADSNDEPQSLLCSKCKVLKERRCFTGRSRKKGDAAVCKECNLNDHRTIRKMKEALNAAMEELEKMKSANGNIAIAAKAEGLGDSIENNGDRMTQLTNMEKCFKTQDEQGAPISLQRKATKEQILICATCKEAKVLSHYSKIQRNQGEAASCEKCVSKKAKAALNGSSKEQQVLFCSICKVEKKLVCFPKKQLIQGATVNCLKCLNKEAKVSLKSTRDEPQTLLCSTCNDAKKLDCFSKMQREQGAAANCAKCINWLQRGKDAKEAKSALTSSTEEQQLLLCSTCKEARRLDCFSKKQRKQGAAASCEKCIEAKVAKKSSTEESQILRCSTCKETKKVDCFPKKQRKQGEADNCMKCIQVIDNAKLALSKAMEGWEERKCT